MSDYLKGKAVRKITEGIAVERDAALPPQSDTEDLFTVVGGRVLLKQIIGEVTTQIGNVANATKLEHNPDDASAGDMCGTVDIDNDDVGTVYGITGTVGTAMQKSTDVLLAQASPQILKAGAIEITCAGSSVSGGIKWTVVYVPIDDGAYIETA